MILVASTTAPAGPEDVVGRAMTRVGAQIERFLAPVEPGNLLLLAYKDEMPIDLRAGLFPSAKAERVDLVLPPLLARYRIRLGSRLPGPRRLAGLGICAHPTLRDAGGSTRLRQRLPCNTPGTSYFDHRVGAFVFVFDVGRNIELVLLQ